jgi:hypothetical protein
VIFAQSDRRDGLAQASPAASSTKDGAATTSKSWTYSHQRAEDFLAGGTPTYMRER